MRQTAVVIENGGGYAVVEVKRTSACEACEQAGTCFACGKLVRLRVKNNVGAGVGDTVTLEAPSANVLGYAAAVFVLPIVLAFVCWGAFDAVMPDTAAAVAIPVAVFVLTFAGACFLLDKRAKAKPQNEITGIVGFGKEGVDNE